MKRRRQKGAVMTFLVIILVPVLVIASVFADVSRVQLSKSSAVSAADLALYSLMANYDIDLKEKYGFLASSQDMGDDMYSKYANYYKGMMNDTDLDDDMSHLLAAWNAKRRTGDTTDLLQTTISDVTVSAADNAELGKNSAIIEDQIVQFMKYRAIPDMVRRILSIINVVKDDPSKMDTLESLVGADRDKDMDDAKEKFGDAESRLLEDAFNEYIAIYAYREFIKQSGLPTFDSYDEIEKYQKNLQKDLDEVTVLITKYYAATDGMKEISFPDTAGITVTTSDVGTPDETGTRYLTQDDYNSLMTEYNNFCSGAKVSITTAANNIMSSKVMEISGRQATDNEAIYFKMMGELVSNTDLNTLKSSANTVVSLLSRLNTAASLPVKEDDASSEALWKLQLRSAANDVSEVETDYYTSNGSSSYSKMWHNYIASPNFGVVEGMVRDRTYKFQSTVCAGYEGGTVDISIVNFLNNVKSEINTKKQQLQLAQQLLEATLDEGKAIKSYNADGSLLHDYGVKSPGIDSLLSDAKEMDDALEEWKLETKKAEAENPKSATVQQNQEAIKEVEDNFGKGIDEEVKVGDSDLMTNHITEESVNELKERLENIKKDVDEAAEKIDIVSYGGKKISEIGDANEMISLAKSTGIPTITESGGAVAPDNAISVKFTTEEATANLYKDRLVGPTAYELYNHPDHDLARNGNDPDLTESGKDHWPALYTFMDSQFGVKDIEETQDEVKKAKDQNDKIKDQAKKEKDGALEIDTATRNEMGEGGISDVSDDTTASVGSAIKGIVELIKKLASNEDGSSALEDLRDRLLVTEYVVCMLSNATTSWEGCYKLDKTLTNEDYGNGDGSKTPYEKVYTEQWRVEDTTKTPENQSLTNVPFNKKYNKIYLGEEEYILFAKKADGDGTGLENNIKAAYKMIFGIREALDLVSGFMLYWPDNATNSTAMAINSAAQLIATATCGIIPVVLTKTITIIAISTLEAANDVKVLKHGVPIKFFKGIDPKRGGDSTNWKYAIPEGKGKTIEIGDNASDASAPEDRDSGVYYSEYLLFYMLISENETDVYSGMLKRIGDVVEANMQLQCEKDDFDLDKSICYFKLNANQEVKPLLLGLPYAKSQYANDSGIGEFLENKNWCSYKIDIVRGYS